MRWLWKWERYKFLRSSFCHLYGFMHSLRQAFRTAFKHVAQEEVADAEGSLCTYEWLPLSLLCLHAVEENAHLLQGNGVCVVDEQHPLVDVSKAHKEEQAFDAVPCRSKRKGSNALCRLQAACLTEVRPTGCLPPSPA